MTIESGRPDRQSDAERPIVEDTRLPYMKTDGAAARDVMQAEDRIEATAGSTLPPPLAVDGPDGPTERMAPAGSGSAPYRSRLEAACQMGGTKNHTLPVMEVIASARRG